MRKIVSLILLCYTLLLADGALKELQNKGITIIHNGKKIEIKRKKNPLCSRENLKPEPLFGGDYAGYEVNKVCKKTFVTHVGVLQPMQLARGIITVGEVEVLNHIIASKEKPENNILMDARREKWYNQMTIPSAINFSFKKIKYDKELDVDDFADKKEYKSYQQNYKRLFKLLNIKETKEGLSFAKVKKVLLFCNGSWCSQSPKAIASLLNMGYPADKILWYRGGLQDWLIYDFTVIKK